MFERFGKSCMDIMDLKRSFFDENAHLHERAMAYADVYISQPPRKKCKICNHSLSPKPTFVKHKVPYVICEHCTHLNGMHEDTDSFCRAVYTVNDGKGYAKNYASPDRKAYRLRRDNIYRPKAEFLFDVLAGEGLDPGAVSYADIGAGAGYFVSSILRKGAGRVQGFEVNDSLVRLGKQMDPELPVESIGLEDTVRICADCSVDILTFIGVFEHLQRFRDVLAAVRKNTKVKYIYFCVPLFSQSVFSELTFPDVFPRQLSSGHTHLFTDRSIRHFENEFGFERVGAWWFGTDMMDHYRSVMIAMAGLPQAAAMTSLWKDQFLDLIDQTQLAIDKRRKCSQVHMVMKVYRNSLALR